MRKKVTLSLDAGIYRDFQDYCDKNDIMLSRKIERLLKEFMDKKEEKK